MANSARPPINNFISGVRPVRLTKQLDDASIAITSTVRPVSEPKEPEAAELDLIGSFTIDSLDGRAVPTRAWHVPDLIPAHTVTMLGGDGATGKSLLAIQLSAATALGREWVGYPVERGRALYLSAEDSADELHLRFADVARGYGCRLSDLADVRVIPLADRGDAVLGAPDGTGTIKPTELMTKIEALTNSWRPTVIVLDTLADLFGGQEINRTQARQFISLLRSLALRYQATIVLLAHPSLNGLNTGTGTSGSTGWNNSVRSRLYLERITVPADGGKGTHEPDENLRRFKRMKANYGPKGEEMILRWRDGMLWPEIEQYQGGLTKVSNDMMAEGIFLDLVRAYNLQGRPVSGSPSNTFAPAVFANEPSAKGLTKAALQGAMNRLFAAGRLRNEVSGPPSKQRSRLLIAE